MPPDCSDMCLDLSPITCSLCATPQPLAYLPTRNPAAYPRMGAFASAQTSSAGVVGIWRMPDGKVTGSIPWTILMPTFDIGSSIIYWSRQQVCQVAPNYGSCRM